MYKTWCEDSNVPYPLSKRAFKEEMKNYFEDFKDRHVLAEGKRIRNYYIGFLDNKFNSEDVPKQISIKEEITLDLSIQPSVFDELAHDYPAQYTRDDGTPKYKWENVKTTLKEIDTSKLHYVKVPTNHIIIDFDLVDEKGEKSLAKNLEAASKWPKTYAELSKSGKGIHLHYIYSGDAETKSNFMWLIYDFEVHGESRAYTR